jgi:hypothetical protein
VAFMKHFKGAQAEKSLGTCGLDTELDLLIS